MSWIQEFVYHLRGVSRPGVAGRVLAIMAKDENAEVLLRIAEERSWLLEIHASFESAVGMMAQEPWPVILYDRELSEAVSWRARLESLARGAPTSSVILLSTANDDQLWQEVIQLGGFDVLTKPFERDRVLRSIEFALRNNSLADGIKD